MPSYLSNVQMNQNQLLQPVIHVAASAPGSPVAGQMYYNSSSHILFYYNGTTWIEADATTVASSAVGGIPISALATAAAAISMGGFNINAVADPTTAQQAATKNYVDSVAQGFSWKSPVQVATATTLPSYVYASASQNGVGDTITASANGVYSTVDSQGIWTAANLTVSAVTFVTTTVTVTVSSTANMAAGQPVSISGITGFSSNNPNGDYTVASIASGTTFTYVVGAAPVGTYTSGGTVVSNAARVLVKNETSTNTPYNGIYTVTALGTAGAKYVLTRATDMDTNVAPDTGAAKYDFATMFVELGTTNAATQWQCANTGGVTPGVTNVTFTQIGASTSYTAGTGLTLSGSQFSINAAYTGQTSITVVGTVATGTWQGNNIAVAYGGTGGTAGAQTAAGARTNLAASGLFTATSVSTTGGSAQTVTHNLNNATPQVTVWSASSGGSVVYCDVASTGVNTITITTAASQTGLVVVVEG